MKILRHRNLLGCLFAVLLSLPLLNVLSRVLYTQWNKNAYQSYSNSGLIEKTSKIGQTTQLSEGLLYNAFIDMNEGNTGVGSSVYYYKSISIDWTSYGATSGLNYTAFSMYKADTTYYVYLRDDNTILFTFWDGIRAFGNDFSFSFVSNSNSSQNGNQPMVLYTTLYEEESLDNAFEYSINKITVGNNIGEVKFFTWFADLFLDLDNSSNALYINFINWYFNYAILVSAVYILFLVLMWFINFIRKLLERGMDFGQRGY